MNSVPPYVRKLHFMYEVDVVHQANAAGAFTVHKQMPLEHISYIKEKSWNTSGRT